MTWITNHPKPLAGMWPRRRGVEYREGRPKATGHCSVGELEGKGLIGVYVDMPIEDYRALPRVNAKGDGV